MTPAIHRLAAVIAATGPDGISRPAWAEAAGISDNSLRQKYLGRLRAAGVLFYLLRNGRKQARYYARLEWRKAAAAANAERIAESRREAERLRSPRGTRPKAAKPKLHALGAPMRAMGIDGKPVPKHNQITQRTPKPVVSVAKPDFSRAKLTVCPSSTENRFTPTVVHRVVDSSECRAWARAATGASA